MGDNVLTRKLGPLPTWGWAAAIAAGVWIWTFLKGRQTSANTTPQEYSWDYGTVLDGGSDLSGSTGSGGGSLISDGSTGFNAPGSTPRITSNDMWGRIGADYLVSLGADPLLVAGAVAKYFSGLPLTEAEKAIINQLLRQFGSPPEGIIPPVNGPTPTNPTTPTGANTPARYPGNPRPVSTTTFVVPGPGYTWETLLKQYPPGSTNSRALKQWHSTHGGNPVLATWLNLPKGTKIRLPVGSPGIAG